jgi:hypothetical protein
LITVHSSSKNLTPYDRFSNYSRIPLLSSGFSTGSSALITNYNQQLYNTRLDSTSLLTRLLTATLKTQLYVLSVRFPQHNWIIYFKTLLSITMP